MLSLKKGNIPPPVSQCFLLIPYGLDGVHRGGFLCGEESEEYANQCADGKAEEDAPHGYADGTAFGYQTTHQDVKPQP